MGQLISELMRFFLPGLDEEEIADLMEEVLPTSEVEPLQIGAEELRAVLEGDAAVVEARQEHAADKSSGHAAMEQEIIEQAAQLRRAARSRKARAAQASATSEQQAAVAPDPGVTPKLGGQHWTGKGGAHWTAQASC